MKQTVAAFIAKTLEQAGVKRIWGVTGDIQEAVNYKLKWDFEALPEQRHTKKNR